MNDDLSLYDTSGLRLGKKDAVRPAGLRDLRQYVPDGFPPPPASFGVLRDLQAVPWGMDGNDTVGDCTIAGADHVIAAENAWLGTEDPRPTLQVLEAQYQQLSPGDTGCVIAEVLRDWRADGLFSMPGGTNRIGLYAPFDHADQTEFCQVVSFTGIAYLGIQCPRSAQQQYAKQCQSGQLVPWTVVPPSPIEGGHCIVAVGYTTAGLYCVTWGGVVLATWEFIARYCDEAWALISQELGEKGADTLGIDVGNLAADLDALSEHPGALAVQSR
ncbi:MAG TPA: hypothetical protein VME46_13670 [Acidimicrobiales bacterium]|nr:hypothetical protein [Acidimicrobiales bacterium]